MRPSFIKIPVGKEEITATAFEPEHYQKVVMINSATGLRQQFYYDFARYLTKQGYAVYTYDYRGVGKSKTKTLKEYEVSFSTWGQEDYPAMANYVLTKHNDKEIFLIGHSIGGNCIGMSEVTNSFTGVMTVGSHHGYIGFYDWYLKPLVALQFGFIMPLMSKLLGYTPSKRFGLGDNLPKNIAKEWAATCFSRNSILDFIDPKFNFYHRITRPMMMISMEDDIIATKAGVDALAEEGYYHAQMERKHIRLKDYNIRKLGHIKLFKKEFKDSLWSIFPQWMEKISQSEKVEYKLAA